MTVQDTSLAAWAEVLLQRNMWERRHRNGQRSWWQWCTSLIPALRGQTQANLCEFEEGMLYKVSSGNARAVTKRNSVSKMKKYDQRKNGRQQGNEPWVGVKIPPLGPALNHDKMFHQLFLLMRLEILPNMDLGVDT